MHKFHLRDHPIRATPLQCSAKTEEPAVRLPKRSFHTFEDCLLHINKMSVFDNIILATDSYKARWRGSLCFCSPARCGLFGNRRAHSIASRFPCLTPGTLYTL